VTITGAGGRRDGENNGRSRVAVSALSGTAQSGLALPIGAAGDSIAAWKFDDVAGSAGAVTQSAKSTTLLTRSRVRIISPHRCPVPDTASCTRAGPDSFYPDSFYIVHLYVLTFQANSF
jgi:hypothetical protein